MRVFFAILSFVIIIIILDAMPNGNSSSEEPEPRSWASMNEGQKEQFLKAVRRTDNDVAWNIESVVEHVVKEQFKYPKEVTFTNEYATKVEHMAIRNITTGEVIFKGKATGKNAFGVKQEVGYYVIMKLRPDKDKLKLVDAGLNE